MIRKTGSTAIRADALHYATDLITNAATVLALVLATYGFGSLDPWFGVAIAIYIVYSAGRIGLQLVELLMDRELPDPEREAIRLCAVETQGVLGVHGLRTWRSGQRKVIQMHLELDPDMGLQEAHHIAVTVEEALLLDEPDADITIHQDPADASLANEHNLGDRFRH